jgi:hypothetical protein
VGYIVSVGLNPTGSVIIEKEPTPGGVLSTLTLKYRWTIFPILVNNKLPSSAAAVVNPFNKVGVPVTGLRGSHLEFAVE